MKKIVFGILLCSALAGVSVFAFEGEDLKHYPSATPANRLILNAGIGFNSPEYGHIKIPSILASLDYNLPISGLPFFVGGIVGFYSAGWTGLKINYFDFGGRFGYHFNWDVDKLDTYAVVTLGASLGSRSGFTDNDFLFGVHIGGRWLFTPKVGAFLELGYSDLSILSGGVTVRF